MEKMALSWVMNVKTWAAMRRSENEGLHSNAKVLV